MTPIPEERWHHKIDRNRKWTGIDTTLHEAVGGRKDLQCPRCGAIGTYKAHGTIAHDGGGHRRWLCKFCGYYFGSPAADPQAEGEYQCQPNSISGAWAGPGAPGNEPTPMELIYPIWPWR